MSLRAPGARLGFGAFAVLLVLLVLFALLGLPALLGPLSPPPPLGPESAHAAPAPSDPQGSHTWIPLAPGDPQGSHTWTPLAPGADLGRFRGAWPTVAGDTTIIVLRLDPQQWVLRLFCASESVDQAQMTAREWCERYNLVAATNAGMFATDHSTHVGYLRSGAHLNNSHVNDYQSAVAFCRRAQAYAPFRIFDLDDTPLDTVLDRYACVVQNLRLIKRPGENRWSQQTKRWSEAALGEDGSGRVLMIFCRSPYSMHDFNKILLSLPIDLVCAQHLEGGPEAQLAVRFPGFEEEYTGSYETGFMANDLNLRAWAIPNIIGIASPEGDEEEAGAAGAGDE